MRIEADAAVKARSWKLPYFVDADHVGMKTIDGFLDSCDYFTLDVADYIGGTVEPGEIDGFIARHGHLMGPLKLPGMPHPLQIDCEGGRPHAARKFLAAVRQAGLIYRRLAEAAAGNSPWSSFRWTRPNAPKRRANCFRSCPPRRRRASPCRR
jgi:hypothetical protein